jgi:hypothetical protein
MGWIDYSGWRGTGADRLRERLVMDDLEREMETEALDRIMRAGSREETELADKVNSIQTPWLSGEQSTEAIVEDLDKFYNENK